ncbi:MAG: Hsp20/alpha crystallin family protein [Chitinophagaceae bacterium]|nr:Hsp20/alpha crystallin family protein [Chitinophagaceae bacterium]
MYLQRKHRAVPATFSGLMDSFFGNGFFHDDENWGNITTPVNIKENENDYTMEVMAPGLKKEDFMINVEKDILSVSFEQKENNEEKADNYIRREYKQRSFKRNFTLSEKIDASNISAKYTDGVLHISLPKAKQEEPAKKNIQIA